ncbi:MAG: patatin-like phospholipase family protein [Nitrososphaeraceae archaeon]
MMSNIIENVLILQGGGSLGAFGCGVFKSLAENNINIDIVAGTSIGGVNAAIIAGYTRSKLYPFNGNDKRNKKFLSKAVFNSKP